MERKARKKIKYKNLDMTRPIDITQFGSEDDPCFGKHHDPKASECQRCGDAEICSIICSQKLHIKRENIEKKQKFKDIGLLEISDEKTLNQVVFDKIKESGKALSIVVIAKHVIKKCPEYKSYSVLEIGRGLKAKFKVSSLFTLYKKNNKTFVKLKK